MDLCQEKDRFSVKGGGHLSLNLALQVSIALTPRMKKLLAAFEPIFLLYIIYNKDDGRAGRRPCVVRRTLLILKRELDLYI